jgi:hypothetical protein
VPTEDEFGPNDPLPLFLSRHADEPEERSSLLRLNASILFLVASLVGMVIILSWGNPAKVFADIKASLTDPSAPQPDTVQSTPTIQSTADARALPPTSGGAPVREEIATTFATAGPSQAEISTAPPGALLKQFQDWAATENPPAQVEPAQVETVPPAQDARAQVLQSAQARTLPVQKHLRVRPVQNARAENQNLQNPRARVRRDQNAQVPVRPVQDARAQDQPVQNAQTPSLLQSLGLQQ